MVIIVNVIIYWGFFNFSRVLVMWLFGWVVK